MRDIGSHAPHLKVMRRPPPGRKPLETAVPVVQANRRGRIGAGVEKPCRCPAGPAASLLPARWPARWPDASPARTLWVIISAPWYYNRRRPPPGDGHGPAASPVEKRRAPNSTRPSPRGRQTHCRPGASRLPSFPNTSCVPEPLDPNHRRAGLPEPPMDFPCLLSRILPSRMLQARVLPGAPVRWMPQTLLTRRAGSRLGPLPARRSPG